MMTDKRIKWPKSEGFKNVVLPLSITKQLDDLKENDSQSYAFVISHLIKYYTGRRKT